jgi:hypothetical protein
MTDVLDRADGARNETPSEGDGDGNVDGPVADAAEVASPGRATTPRPAAGGFAPADALLYLLAGLSAAAGVIHLAMVPSHMGEWAAEGIAFAVVGWLQLIGALLIVGRPSRLLLAASILANMAFVGAWVVTRTSGPPWGPHAGVAESASSVDITTVAMEMALVLLAALALIRPGLALLAGPIARRGALGGATAIVVLASVVLASPSARNHAHGHDEAGTGHTHGAAAAGHSHSEAGATIPGGDDRGWSALSNGHHQHTAVNETLDPATQAKLDDQLAITREVAARYPTVADAEAGGYRRIGPYFPGIGAHYGKTGEVELNRSGDFDDDTIAHPFTIIYDGTLPTSRVAGFMYLSMADKEPEGFAGPNDVWHYHESLCLKWQPGGVIDVPFGLDHQATADQCSSAGGRLLPISPWMVHVWSAPGWDDDPEVGTFGEFHTDLTCSDGTYYMLPVEQWVDHTMNICRADAA